MSNSKNHMDVVSINEKLSLREKSKKDVVSSATEMAKEFNGLQADQKFAIFAELSRLKDFISTFDKAIKSELVNDAVKRGLNKESESFNGVNMQVVTKKNYDYSSCGSETYKNLLNDLKSTKDSVSDLQDKMKGIDSETKEIFGEELSKPTFKENNEMKTTY